MTFLTVVIFTVCLKAAEPDKEVCDERRVTYYTEAQLTPQACMLNAMPRLAEWSEINPKYRIKDFKCTSKPEFKA